MTLAWAVHRVGGICLFAHPTSTGVELRRQLQATGCRTIFTCTPLLPLCLDATAALQLAGNQIFLLDDPNEPTTNSGRHMSVEDLIQKGKSLGEIEKPKWNKGQGATQTAFLCSSSGTSGTQVSPQLIWIGDCCSKLSENGKGVAQERRCECHSANRFRKRREAIFFSGDMSHCHSTKSCRHSGHVSHTGVSWR
jgi:hypothetical protein